MPSNAITDTNQKCEERKLQSGKDLLDTYRNMFTALREIFDISIYPEYHSGVIMNMGMVRRGFVNNKPPAILERLKRFYGTPILQELDQALLCLHNPI